VPDLKGELRRLADDAARQAQPLPVTDVIQEGDRRQRRAITPRRRESAGAPGPATRAKPGRHWPGWATPLAAAAAVTAVIVVAVTVSGALHGRGPAAHRPTATLYVEYTVARPARPHNPPQFGGTIVPISTATNRAGKPIHISGMLGGSAFTPDGKTLYVGYQRYVPHNVVGGIVPISTATGTPGKPIPVSGAGEFAITPDGKTVYVGGTDKIVPVSTATNTPGKPIHIYGGADDIEFTPDSRTAYVLPAGVPSRIVPISTATGTPGQPIRVCRARPGTNPRLDFARWSAITPDGKTLYVGCNNTVIPISTATNTAGKPIRVRGGGIDIVFTPDSKTAYIGDGSTVTPISTATNTAGPPIHVGIPVAEVIAITPDGKTVYVTHYEGRPTETIVPISTATNTAGPPIHIGSSADALAITPDGKTLYAATGTTTRNTVTPVSTATNRAGMPIYISRGRFFGGELLAVTP
jgi:DNA-binding beta-propeller fold protein YncE